MAFPTYASLSRARFAIKSYSVEVSTFFLFFEKQNLSPITHFRLASGNRKCASIHFFFFTLKLTQNQLDFIQKIVVLFCCFSTFLFLKKHGYPANRRSLADDAKFETIKNKEAKRNWIAELRQCSHDYEMSEDEVLVLLPQQFNISILII